MRERLDKGQSGDPLLVLGAPHRGAILEPGEQRRQPRMVALLRDWLLAEAARQFGRGDADRRTQ